MAIQKYNDPFSSSEELMPSSFSSMLDRFFNNSMHAHNMMSNFTPHVDTAETDKSYEIEVSLPGLKRDEINIDFDNGRLTISGERHFSDEKKNKRYHMMESQYGSFSRSFSLPETTKPENIDANFENGVLKISVPKEKTSSTKRQIWIKTGDSPQQLSGGSDKPVNGDKNKPMNDNKNKPTNGRNH